MPDVWRVRGAPAFAALSRPRDHGGSRRRSGPVTVTWVPVGTHGVSAPVETMDPAESGQIRHAPRELTGPAVAFAIGRRVGPAVVRNRLRRRLRDELATLARQGLLRPGCYLVGLRPEAAPLDGPALRAHLRSLVAA